MSHLLKPRFKHYTAFRSAADDAGFAAESRARWENDGGHPYAGSGQVIRTPDATQPYMAVVDHGYGAATKQGCCTMREGEEIIRQQMPAVAPRSTMFDRGAPPPATGALRS